MDESSQKAEPNHLASQLQATPLIIQLASPLPDHARTGTVARAGTQISTSTWTHESWEQFGAKYDSKRSLWLCDGSPLVENRKFLLGTKTLTASREGTDEDE